MVGCKDDPSHQLSKLSLSHQQSPTLNEQDARLAYWLCRLHCFSPTPPRSPHTSTSTSDKAGDNLLLALQSMTLSYPNNHIRPSANAQRSKRNHPGKSARLEQKRRISADRFSTSASETKVAEKATGATRGQERDEGKGDVGHVVTRGQSQGKVGTADSSDKEKSGYSTSCCHHPPSS